MLKLKVPEMSCGHCVATIEKAVRSVDPAARVEADLASKIVEITTAAGPDRISDAVRAAGYDNQPAGD